MTSHQRKRSLEVNVRDLLSYLDIKISRKTKDEYNISCPFHDDKHPSASISETRQLFNCFRCGGMTIQQFVERLAGKEQADNILKQFVFADVTTVDERLAEILHIEEEDSIIDEDALQEYEPYHPYLKGRGMTRKTARFYGIGYSRRDRRVTIPIRDHHGLLRGVVGRAIGIDDAKYSAIIPCHWNRYLFGEYLYSSARRRILVEGPFAVLRLRRYEQPAVAAMKSKISERQLLRLLEVEKLYIGFDNDEAGQAGTEKAIALLPKAKIIVWPKDVDTLTRKEILEAIRSSMTAYEWSVCRPTPTQK